MESPHRAKVGCSQPELRKSLQLGLATLVSSLLLSTLPVVLLTTGIGGILLLNGGNARAESPEDVAKIAQAITVRIEGATQGSGILVRHSGGRYTVLTAWHVVSSQQQGEELAVITPDGKEYQVVPGSIRRVANVDQAELSFDSPESYAIATQARQRLVGIGSTIFISGFSLPTSAVPRRVLRVMDGKIVASPITSSADGYGLLYSNPTMPGMSGGAILDDKGQLVGVHARSETQDVKTESQDVYVKTGTGQGVSISYYQTIGAESAEAKGAGSTTNLANTLGLIAQQPLPTKLAANDVAGNAPAQSLNFTRLKSASVTCTEARFSVQAELKSRGFFVPYRAHSGTRLETVVYPTLTLDSNSIEKYYYGAPTGRPQQLNINLSGDYDRLYQGLLSSPVYLSYLGARIMEACPDIGMVGFNHWYEGGVPVGFFPDGTARTFKRVDDRDGSHVRQVPGDGGNTVSQYEWGYYWSP